MTTWLYLECMHSIAVAWWDHNPAASVSDAFHYYALITQHASQGDPHA